MGEFIDKAKGAANVVVGEAKQALGEHNRDAELNAEGSAQAAKGHLQKAKGAIKGAFGDKL